MNLRMLLRSLCACLATAVAASTLAPTAAAQPVSSWEEIPKAVRDKKSFKRFEWFYRQRALPDVVIPAGALEQARDLEIARALARPPAENLLALTWSQVGPAGVVSTYPSQWGVVSGRVRALAVDPLNPQTIYIGAAAGGIWKTTNGGTSWQDAGGALASLTFGAIAIDPSNTSIVYAGAGESIRYFNTTTYSGKGMYKSTDGGSTWTQITSGFGSTTHFGAVRVSPTSTNTVFAALGSGNYHASTPGNEGLWRSTDAGVTWTRTLNADDGFDVLPHPTTANRVYGATGGAVSTAGFYRSTNNGANWTQVTTGLPASTSIHRMQLALSTGTPATLYALIYTEPSGVGTASLYKSTNDGTNWSSVGSSYTTGQGWYDLTLAVNPTDVNEVYIGTEELRRSTNGGSTFSYVGGSYWSQSMHVDFHVMAFAPSSPATRYVGCDGGIYRSTDGGSTWLDMNGTLPTLQYYRLGSHPTDQNTMTGGSQDNGVFKTTNGGSGNWTLVSTGDGMECFYDAATPTTVYASTQYGALVKSTTGGNYGSFTSIQPTTGDLWAWTAPFFAHPTTSTTLYTASQRPWRSTDGGSSWTDLNGGALTSARINTMAQSPANPSNMILAASEWTATPPVYVSTNGGTAWTSVGGAIGGTQAYISRVLFDPTGASTCYVVRSGFYSGNKIYRSTNLGTSWTNVSGDLPNVPHNDLFIDPAVPADWYAANDLGVYLSTNGGVNWVRQGTNFPYVPALDFSYFNSGGVRLLRAATHGRSAYQASLSGTQSVQVLAPNGGEVWRTGTVQQIQWNSSGLTGNVNIDLSRNGGTVWESLFSSSANDGSEPWTVAGAPTPLALVRVSSVTNPAIRDSSNSIFSIIQPSLTVTAPNGGETWTAGMMVGLNWASVNLTGNVRLELSRNGGTSFDTLAALTPDDGNELWMVTGPATTQALLRVVSIDIPTVSDQSDAAFTILGPAIGMLSPAGGETWAVGSAQSIQWASSAPSGPVRIELSRNSGTSYDTVLFPSTADDGAEVWNVQGPASATCRVRVVNIADTSVAGASGGDFSIVLASLTLLSPAGGEVWPVDSTRSVLWSSSSVPGNVSISLSRDGGASFATLAANTANDGVEAWTVTGPVTTQARIRVAAVADTTIQSISAADFSIASLRTVSSAVTAGWNMLSVPLLLPDLRKSQVFPDATSPAYAYSTAAGYLQRDTLRYGEGYWLDYDSAGTLSLSGGARDADTVHLTSGWNMIGTIGATVPVDSIVEVPSGLLVTPFYVFNGSAYVTADSLKEMRSYWVKAQQAGSVVLRKP